MSEDPYFLDAVSPQFPCGAAWLANCLLELGLQSGELWGFDTSTEWSIEPDGHHRYIAEHLPWRQTLASLRLGRQFAFRPGFRCRFTHAFPWQLQFGERILLVVRDPRDVMYSEWQRQRRNLGLTADFAAFTRQGFDGGPISNIDMLWLHLSCWLHVEQSRPARVLVVRFEDWKRSAAAALRRVCDWAGIDASDHDLEIAVAASDVSHLQAIEGRLDADGMLARQFNRRGQAFEWRERAKHESSSVFGSHWCPLFDRFAYSAPAFDPSVSAHFDVRGVLAWRGMCEPEEVAIWTRRISRWKGTW